MGEKVVALVTGAGASVLKEVLDTFCGNSVRIVRLTDKSIKDYRDAEQVEAVRRDIERAVDELVVADDEKVYLFLVGSFLHIAFAVRALERKGIKFGYSVFEKKAKGHVLISDDNEGSKG